MAEDDSNSLQTTHHYHQQIEQEFDDLYTHSLNYNLPRFNYTYSLPLILPDPTDPFYISGHESDDADSLSDMNYVTNLFENGLDCVQNDDQDSIFMGVNENLEIRVYGSDQDGEDELGFEFGGLEGGVSGLRVVDIDSESDVEEVEEIGEFDDGECFSGDRNCVRFENDGEGGGLNEEIRWDEVDGDRQEFNSEVRVNSDVWEEDDSVDIEDEGFRDLEWEILLAANNFSGEFEVENDDGVLYVTVQDEYLYVQAESALKGSPPAAKSVVENLVSVVLTKDYVKENNVERRDGLGWLDDLNVRS
ncbi:RING-type domain-containing protein [Heracleum sosnowskyi]|uniref:RING-type domain-containing protein n=1 Tax=Heracleum sosnowskyi TaxID=360622 RepID=A0AAD8H9V2_9APIA|nr:RING-type domain-containing protein [Heracleum sosnowskyi]